MIRAQAHVLTACVGRFSARSPPLQLAPTPPPTAPSTATSDHSHSGGEKHFDPALFIIPNQITRLHFDSDEAMDGSLEKVFSDLS